MLLSRTFEIDSALKDVVEPQNQTDDGCLATARWPDESSDAFFYLQIKSLEQRVFILEEYILENNFIDVSWSFFIPLQHPTPSIDNVGDLVHFHSADTETGDVLR